MAPDDETGSPIEGERLTLDFPCPWTYTVIGPDPDRLRTAIEGIVGDADHSITPSHESRHGKYLSLHLEVIVRNDEERLAIFRRLHDHADVAFVL